MTCRTGLVCVSVVGDRTLGPARGVAQGFINGIDSSTNSAFVDQLHARSWLVASGDAASASARSAHATITSIISDAWGVATYVQGQGPEAPWLNLPAFSRFVQNLVRTSQATGQPVTYWEVQNEPDGYFGKVRATPAQALEEFRVGVQAVRSIDPHAKILGPALSAWNDHRGSPTLDLPTFLDYVVAHHLPLDAVAWHEVGARANPSDTTPDPASVGVHVARMRQLLAVRPALGHPAIMITEYGSNASHLIPGQAVGWIGALEDAAVDGANVACWHSPSLEGQRLEECHHGALDGLFIPGSGLPTAVYAVHRFYAAMTGVRLATSTTDTTVTGFATRDDTKRTMLVMVGRHQTCTPDVRVDCTEPTPPTPPPNSVDLHISVPYAVSAVSVTLQQVANHTGVDFGPVTIWSQTIPVGPGPVVVPIRDFADGDAYLVTLAAG